MGILTRRSKRRPGGILKLLGIEAEPVPTEAEERRQSRHQKMELAWAYLRDRIDRGIDSFYATGDPGPLGQFVEPPALDALRDHLQKLAAGRLVVCQPDRKAQTAPALRIVDETLDSNEMPLRFVVQERFQDRTQLLQPGADGELKPVAVGDGADRAIQATVTVQGGRDYKLHSVVALVDDG